jgi:hypothetical protein
MHDISRAFKGFWKIRSYRAIGADFQDAAQADSTHYNYAPLNILCRYTQPAYVVIRHSTNINLTADVSNRSKSVSNSWKLTAILLIICDISQGLKHTGLYGFDSGRLKPQSEMFSLDLPAQPLGQSMLLCSRLISPSCSRQYL